MSKKIILVTLAIIIYGGLAFGLYYVNNNSDFVKTDNTSLTRYASQRYNITFDYPSSWGSPRLEYLEGVYKSEQLWFSDDLMVQYPRFEGGSVGTIIFSSDIVNTKNNKQCSVDALREEDNSSFYNIEVLCYNSPASATRFVMLVTGEGPDSVLNQRLEIVKNIIKTLEFDFASVEPTLEPQSWKRFYDKEFGISFNYPASYGIASQERNGGGSTGVEYHTTTYFPDAKFSIEYPYVWGDAAPIEFLEKQIYINGDGKTCEIKKTRIGNGDVQYGYDCTCVYSTEKVIRLYVWGQDLNNIDSKIVELKQILSSFRSENI